MKKDTKMYSIDFIDKLLLLLFAIFVLLLNIGIVNPVWFAYWPLFLFVWIIKEFLDE